MEKTACWFVISYNECYAVTREIQSQVVFFCPNKFDFYALDLIEILCILTNSPRVQFIYEIPSIYQIMKLI